MHGELSHLTSSICRTKQPLASYRTGFLKRPQSRTIGGLQPPMNLGLHHSRGNRLRGRPKGPLISPPASSPRIHSTHAPTETFPRKDGELEFFVVVRVDGVHTHHHKKSLGACSPQYSCFEDV